jgi:hypothetical protein
MSGLDMFGLQVVQVEGEQEDDLYWVVGRVST